MTMQTLIGSEVCEENERQLGFKEEWKQDTTTQVVRAEVRSVC
jgi:hypothetical protein